MTIYRMDANGISPVEETSFAEAGVYERRDIQQFLLKNIDVLDDRLMVIAEEFGEWLDSSRRIDLLCIDTEANLVVVELKRTEDGGHMDLQSLRYAAMISNMTFMQLIEAHSRFVGCDQSKAEAAILQFLEWDRVDEERFAQDVRIVLAAADFGKELTTTAIWLNERDIKVTCVRLKPYRLSDGQLLLDIQQLIPLPEATAYQTQIGVKKRAERESRSDRHSLRQEWWSTLVARPAAEPHAHILPKPSAYHFVKEGQLQWAYLLQQQECGVELFISLGSVQKSQQLYEMLLADREGVESRFGASLIWEPVGQTRGCKVKYMLPGGYKSASAEWGGIISLQVDAMARLRSALQTGIETWQRRGSRSII